MSAVNLIIAPAWQQLQDLTGTTWTVSALCQYLQLGIIEIINLKPDANTTATTVALSAGTKQTIPATAIDLVSVNCNMGSTGAVRGKAILPMPKDTIDSVLPDWQTFTASTVVSFAITDNRDPRTYFVFPPVTGSATAEILCSYIPTAPTGTSSTFSLDDSYIPPCVDYVVGRALMEDSNIPNGNAKAQVFMQRFTAGLGLKQGAETKLDAEGK